MPAIDTSLDLDWTAFLDVFDIGPYPNYQGLVPTNHISSSNYPIVGESVLFFKEFRSTTHRNVRTAETKNWTCLAPPKAKKLAFERPLFRTNKERREFFREKRDYYLGLQDLRKGWGVKPESRPARKGPRPGYHLEMRPDGFRIKLDSFKVLSTSHIKSTWYPVVRSVVVPDRKTKIRTRFNPKMPADLKVNDLLYDKISFIDSSYGQMGLFVSSILTNPAFQHIGSGGLFSLPWLTELGFNQNPVADPRIFVAYEASTIFDSLTSEIDKLSIIAQRRLYTKLKEENVDLATELSQGLQTSKLILDLSIRAAKLLLNLKKLRFSQAVKEFLPSSKKGISNDFLAYSYGVRPLLGDIAGLGTTLAEYVTRHSPVKVNGHAKATFSSEVEHNSYRGSVLFSAGKVITTSEVRVKYGVAFRVSDSLLRAAAKLGFTNPANVIWELVPFSFVVDWLLPIGDFLKGLTSTDGLEVKEVYKTVFVKQKVFFSSYLQDQSSSSGTDPDWYKFNQDTGGLRFAWISERILVKREVIPKLPQLPLPSIKLPFSTFHVGVLTALLTQRV